MEREPLVHHFIPGASDWPPTTALGVAACADPTASGAEEGARYSVLEQVVAKLYGRMVRWKPYLRAQHFTDKQNEPGMIRHMGVQHSHYIVQYSVTRS
jgi:hypothetical protein